MPKIKMNKSEQTRKKAMIKALGKSLGIVSTACKKSKIGRTTHYGWMQKDAKYKKAIDDVSEDVLDFVESKLHQLITEGNIASILFYMKTKGKKRGFIERQQIEIQEVPELHFDQEDGML